MATVREITRVKLIRDMDTTPLAFSSEFNGADHDIEQDLGHVVVTRKADGVCVAFPNEICVLVYKSLGPQLAKKK